jgi:hypothetical protein
MVALPVMQQHLDAATLEAMLRQLLNGDHLRNDKCIEQLCQLPVAAELNIDTVTQLLLDAYVEREFDAGCVFCDLHAAQQLSSEQVEAWMQAAMTHPTGYDSVMFWQAFCNLPGAMQLTSDAVLRVLRTAISMDEVGATEDLVFLPAAAEISSADVASLLVEAFAQPQTLMLNTWFGT